MELAASVLRSAMNLDLARANFCTIAEARLGCVTLWGKKGPRLFDCSGLIAWSLLKAGFQSKIHHKDLNWNAQRMANDLGADQRDATEWQEGDLAFYGPSWADVQHVAIVWTGNQVLSASGATRLITDPKEAQASPRCRVKLESKVKYRKDFLGVCNIDPYLELVTGPELVVTDENLIPTPPAHPVQAKRFEEMPGRIVTKSGAIAIMATTETNALNPVPSSTGTPILAPRIAAWAAGVVAIAAVLSQISGLPAVVYTIAHLIVGIGTVIGIASPGIRQNQLPGQPVAKIEAPKPSV